MIQATNELILGIELNEAYAQMTYYHQTVREPVTLGLNSDTEQLLIPMALRQCANGQWQIWDGKPQLESEEPDRVRISDLYRKIEKKEEQEVEEAAELLSVYFKVCLAKLKLLTQNTKIHIMVTVRRLGYVRLCLKNK